jgi:hypothetical protein
LFLQRCALGHFSLQLPVDALQFSGVFGRTLESGFHRMERGSARAGSAVRLQSRGPHGVRFSRTTANGK